MRTVRRGVIVASVALVGAGAGILGNRLLRRPPARVDSAATNEPPSSAELNELKTHVAALEQAVALNEIRRRSTDAIESTARADASAPLEQPRRSAAPSRASPQELADREARRTTRLESTLSGEARDRSWAPTYEAELQDAVKASAQGGSAPTIESVSCRTTLCRLEISSPSFEAQREFMAAFRAHLPPSAGMRSLRTPADDGSERTTMHFVREGYPNTVLVNPDDD